MDEARAALERLIRERGEDYAGLSRMIRRNPAYIQQYIKRGSPRTLAEEDRRLLARYFGVSEALLGGPKRVADPADPVAVPQLRVGASAGAGALADDERPSSAISFDRRWLRSLGASDVGRLSIIKVQGDSMVPSLSDGDEILVDRGDTAQRLRDGIYVLRLDDMLMVKRLGINPAGRTVSIRSDNPAYPSWPDCPLTSLDIVGRVIWVGRRIS